MLEEGFTQIDLLSVYEKIRSASVLDFVLGGAVMTRGLTRDAGQAADYEVVGMDETMASGMKGRPRAVARGRGFFYALENCFRGEWSWSAENVEKRSVGKRMRPSAWL